MFSPLTHDDPHRLGTYRLIARLGSGGMGTVYLARSAAGRTVALKTMHTRLAGDPAFRTRFRLEVDAARVIGPVHGARVFDADPHAETPWFATEYVIGPPLDAAVTLAGPLPGPAVRALGAGLCAALSQLHASDVVHRDLKPSNIVITADGPKVIDFGIARALGDDRLTRTGAAAGTPAFMSPEQATGQEHTPAGDVFALAGVLTYAATGHGPFGTGAPADLLYRVRYADPDLTGVPADLIPALTRCFGKDPADRPTTSALGELLRDGQGHFADHLPESLLGEIARRAGGVWQARPHRLPAPPPQDTLAGNAPNGAPHSALPASTVPAPSLRSGPSRPSGPSRRKLLTLGGGSVLGVASAGAGTWAWLGRRDGGTDPKPPAGAQGPRWDMLWQTQISYADPRVPPAPLVLDGLLVVGEYGVQGLDPATGKPKWSESGAYFMRRMATDGKQIHALGYTLQESDPLTVSVVDPASGKVNPPFAEVGDLRANLYGTQLLCSTGDALYLTGGRGPHSMDGFLKEQTWFLLGLDARSGRKLWEVPLPARPDKSGHLHFLSARVVGDHLVLVQQAADGEPRLVVRDARTGKARWERPLDGKQPAFSRARPAVDSRHVYPSAGGLLALSLADGKETWRFGKESPSTQYSPPAVKDGVVHAVQEGGGLVAVDAGTGALRWAEKGRAVTAADLDVPPVVGIRYVYGKGASGLVAADVRTGVVAQAVKAAGATYFAHESARRLIALGENHAAAYPLD
ncbi:protein kinase domain-containing protein [Streptomyces sp. NPDC054932]